MSLEAGMRPWSGWEQLSPVLRYANFYDAVPGGGFGPRYIEDFQVLLVQSGQGVVTIEEEAIEIAAGDFIFYDHTKRHAVESGKEVPLKLVGLHFLFCQSDLARLRPGNQRASERAFEYAGGPLLFPLAPRPPARVSPGSTSPLRRHCESLVLSYLSSADGRQIEKRGLLFLMLGAWHEAIVRESRQPSLADPHRRLIEAAEQQLLADLHQPPGSTELASTARMSADHFARLFKRKTGRSVRGFVTEQRLLKARRLLIEGNLNVSETAYAVGFEDPLYFSKLFAKHFGLAPSVLRKEHGIV